MKDRAREILLRTAAEWRDSGSSTYNDLIERQLAALNDSGLTVIASNADMEALTRTVAGLLDAMKWHLLGADGTDQRSLDSALSTFTRHFLER